MDAKLPPDLPRPVPPVPAAGGTIPAPAKPARIGNAAGGGTRIRSVPAPLNRASRLPGTYAANFGGEDMNWRRAVTVLWVLFGLTATLELLRVSFYLLAGYTDWSLVGDVIRVGMSTLVFLTLWLGLGWTRWLLVCTDFLGGLSLFVWSVAGHLARTGLPGSMTTHLPPALITTMPTVAVGLLYLGTAVYLARSADVIDFVRHRREEGRASVLLPVALLAGGYAVVLLTLQVPYLIWVEVQAAQARTFGEDTSRRMASHWDPKSIDGLLDPSLSNHWTPEFKRQAFASLAPLGPLEDAGTVGFFPSTTRFDAARGGFSMQCSYNLRQARFAHGTADIGIAVVKGIFSPWQINDLEINEVHFDPKPPPASETGLIASPVPEPAPPAS